MGVVLGLKHTRTGDTLVSIGGSSLNPIILREIVPPPAVISSSVIPKTHSDLVPVQEALECLARTDPSVRVNLEEGQILVHGMGALHLEIVEGRLRDEWNARFEFGKRHVAYREGLGPGDLRSNSDSWQINIGGKQADISVSFIVRPLQVNEEGDPTWDGNLVLDETGNPFPAADTMTRTPQSFIVRGIAHALSNSPNTSLAISHLHIQLKAFLAPSWVPHPILTSASAAILSNLIRDAGIGPIMEPYVHLKISVNEDSLGRIVKDITEHGGEVLDLGGAAAEEVGGYSEEGVYIPPPWLSPSGMPLESRSNLPQLKRSVYALAPLSKVLDYSNRLRALSGGHGHFEMANAGFREVPEMRQLEILREIGKA